MYIYAKGIVAQQKPYGFNFFSKSKQVGRFLIFHAKFLLLS